VKRNGLTSLALVAGLLLSCGSLFAHHGNAAYDLEKTVTLKATITGFEFGNPHVQIFFDAKDEQGNAKHWSCEGTNPAMLTRIGWNRKTLKPGDEVTIIAHPNRKTGVTVIYLVRVVLANGKELDSRNPV
jgi:hypothetical protein